jgi:SET domain-containing protein
MNYKPLPDFLTIKPSNIDGLGLFATCDIATNVVIGVTHVKDIRFEDGYVRTPLGGFFNHSNEPNCIILYDDDFLKLATIKDINKGEELTATYLWYDPSKKNDKL